MAGNAMETARTLTSHLADLLAHEHSALGEFLLALADFDRRRLWLELGYPSLFDFLHRELGLSKASASFRKKAAELIQRFPETIEPIRDGRLCLSSVFELAKVLTEENRAEVLPRFLRLSKREAKVVAAALRPDDAPALRELVTTVRVPAATAQTYAVETVRLPAQAVDHAVRDGARPATHLGPNPRPELGGAASSLMVVCPAKLPDLAPEPEVAPSTNSGAGPTTEPLTAELNRLHMTVSREFLEKLDAARAALSHSRPGASAHEILEAGLDLVLERAAKRKGFVKKPRRGARPSSDPARVPAQVKRVVWKRDGGRCQWPLDSGGICGSTHRVQLDHRTAKARGGPATVENLRCLCERHNLLAARQTFGDRLMDRYTRNPRAAPDAPVPRAAALRPTPPASARGT